MNITVTELNPVCFMHGAYHNGRCTACDKLEGIQAVEVIETAEQIGGKECEMAQMTVVLKKGKNGLWYYSGKAGNNEIQLPSQGYTRRRDAVRGFTALQRNIARAKIVNK